MKTALMISIRSGDEALAALEGGADIIDIKNPSEGPLGAPSAAMLKEVSCELKGNLPFSIALGEFPGKPGAASLAALGCVYFQPDFIKVAFVPGQSSREIYETLQVIRKSLSMAKDKFVSLVTVAYADTLGNTSWSLYELATISKDAGADGCLVDTWEKKNKSLLDYLSWKKTERWINDCHQLELFCGLAGSLKFSDVIILKDLHPDIIGVRSAVCGGDRLNGKVSAHAVEQLKKTLAVGTVRSYINAPGTAGL